MASIDRNQAPYYDDYDPSKNYTHMLAVPGNVEQARDFTQLQSMIFDYLQRLSSTLLKDGAIMAGMNFAIKDSTILIESGRVYLNGKIHMFQEQEIPFTKTGLEVIGVKLNEYIVTEAEDITLLDPTTTTGNYGQPGTHRIKSEIVLTNNDPESSMLYEFEDGGLKAEIDRPNFDGLSDLLARRTYDESGNYRVSGLSLVAEPHDANNIRIIVEPGVAYVKGYQHIKPTPIKTIVPMAKEYHSVVGEPHTYVFPTVKYLLNNFPARAINRITAYVQVTQTLTRGSQTGGVDVLASTPVADILLVQAGATTYTKNTDYKLTNDTIDWSPAGAEPAQGTSYTITYLTNKTLVQGTDYKLFQEVGSFGETKDYVEFLSGDRPVNNGTFYVDYDFYLGRIDLVSLSKTGEVVITTGASAIPSNLKPPVPTNPELLPLGIVKFNPNSGEAIPTFNSITRLDMSQLQNMLKRVEDLEFNQAITSLDKEAIEGEVSTDLRGIFSDSFRSIVRGDFDHPSFNITYDLETGTLWLPTDTVNTHTPVVQNPASIKTWRRLATVPMLEKVAVNQNTATTSMLVNPYLAFNAMGVLKLKPERDNWIEDTYIKLDKVVFKARNFRRWWRHADDPSYKKSVQDLFDLSLDGKGTVDDWRPAIGDTGVATKVTSSKKVLQEAITYMRRIDVEVTATNLKPSADNLECTFDGVRVPLTPVSPSTAGSVSGTIKANTSGLAKGKFTIPANIKTGTREVILSNSGNTASSAFTSLGTKRTTTETITTTRITLTAVDPLAQSFQFDRETTLTSVGVYFSGKDNTNNILCQIRNVVNGYPGNVVYAETVVAPSSMNVSANASIETKISFDEPVTCEANTQYCMAFLTDSDTHSMYVSDLGGKDVTTGQKVLRQPYLAGMLFSSSNGITWTAHQSMNMKFKIYVASFNASSTLDFVEQSGLNIDSLVLMADTVVPVGCECKWQVSIDGGTYTDITPEEDIDLIKSSSRVKLRAVLKSSGDMSPIIALDSLNVVSFTTGLNGTYVGRNVDLTDPITSVTQVFDAFIPSGCTVTPQFSYNNGTSWITPTQVSVEPVSAEYSRYTCTASIALGQNALDFRARLNIVSGSRTLRPRARRFVNIMK